MLRVCADAPLILPPVSSSRMEWDWIPKILVARQHRETPNKYGATNNPLEKLLHLIEWLAYVGILHLRSHEGIRPMKQNHLAHRNSLVYHGFPQDIDIHLVKLQMLTAFGYQFQVVRNRLARFCLWKDFVFIGVVEQWELSMCSSPLRACRVRRFGKVQPGFRVDVRNRHLHSCCLAVHFQPER